MISQNTIQQILNRIDIIDVVGGFVKLKKRGTNYLGLCPFHNERTPSFTVSPSK
ncbi:MAG TPA: CHC2 zinc finger domain-containing protein, partial [Chitinophagaceae bacterium]|nr:CHC2 zinc finger domain-containing protein [Chitinophagaceae bacterium]